MIDFVKNLVFLYHVIRASESLLLMARMKSTDSLAAYFAEHLEEERGHEKWLAEDLKSVGLDAKRTPIPIEAVEMVGYVYYFVLHVDPCALLGYMLLMEGTPMTPERLEALEKQYGAPLCRTLRYHAEHDHDHAKKIMEIIATLSEDRQKLVKQTFDQCRRYMAEAAQHLRSFHGN